MRYSRYLFIIAVLFFWGPVNLGVGHPHVFIAQKLHLEFDSNGLAGIKVFWQFDDMFSNMIANDHDMDQNGELDKSEVLRIKEKAFQYIAEYDYFFNITIDGTPFKVQFVKEFNARIIYGKLIYEFFIPCHVTATIHSKKVLIASYDPNYYSAIYFVENRPFALLNSEALETRATIAEDKNRLIYYDTVNPWTLFLDFKIKQ